MIVIKARNANQALPETLYQLGQQGIRRKSRNGDVTMFPAPACIEYAKPTERVVFWAERDANPFFHLAESLWMLAGRNDVAYPVRFSSNMGQFSDDGKTFHGAYGHRWRRHFGIDQLGFIAKALTTNPDDRRQVLQMWDARADGNGRLGKDFPCNISAVFARDVEGRLDMTVYNRSNDIVWGALGANCVHFSVLQEMMAAWIGCEVGRYWQISTNMHAYDFNKGHTKLLVDKAFPSQQFRTEDPYEASIVTPFQLVNGDPQEWQMQNLMFLQEGGAAMGYRDPFFRRIAIPMDRAYTTFKDKGNPHRFDDAMHHLSAMPPCDWKLACAEWLNRRRAAAELKARQPTPTPANAA